MSELHILMNAEHIGTLTGRGTAVRVSYDRDLDPATAVPLSLSMPLERNRHRGTPVHNWLSALLPDRPPLLTRWRRDFGVTDSNPESLLAHIGEDVAGAAQFVRDDRLEANMGRTGTLHRLSDDDIAGLAVAAKQDRLPYDPDTSTGQFSLAGAQAKFALQKLDDGWALPAGAEPSTHIFKPAIPGLEDQDVGEAATMRIAAKVGLPVARTFIAEFAGQRVIGVERYDRARDGAGRWWRVHQEDLCQCDGHDPLHKYESQGGPGVTRCAALIREFGNERDVETFARAIIFNYLTKGSDAHARNYSMLLTPGDVRLAPLYDLNSTLLFGETAEARTLAMRIGGEDRLDSISLGNWKLFASEVKLDEAWVLHQVQTMAAAIPSAAADVCAQPDLAAIAPKALHRLAERCTQWASRASAQSLGGPRASLPGYRRRA